jgi:NAD(P)-dependent dehydrogenase (short-subunit alcohol dehydrogenase family)
MGGLKNEVGIVTGGASGIGRATAERLAEEGVKVVIADVDKDSGEELVDRIENDGGEATFVEVDVTNPKSVEAMVEKTNDVYGPPTLAHNNAGIGVETLPTEEYTEDQWASVLEVNLSGVWRSLKAELPVMAENGGGAIVNTASVAGQVVAGSPPYVSSKHGVIGITKSAAAAYPDTGVRVNAVSPGIVDTPLLASHDNQEGIEQMVSGTPMGREAQPEEISSSVAYLLSEDASYVNGHSLLVDGGYTAV